jgi:acetoacetate decarboxylase
MLTGSADIAALAEHAPRITKFSEQPIVLDNVVCFQMTAEMPNTAREAVLPPALHPTIPAGLSVQVYDVGDSDWGAFKFAITRVSCRSGVRARGFTTATIVDGKNATKGMHSMLGFPSQPGDIQFRHGYDGVSIDVTAQAHNILKIDAIDPEPMGPNDVQYTGTLNLAHTPMGLRLLQIEAQSEATQVDRLQARLLNFDPRAWGNELLTPNRVIAASVVKMRLTYAPVRFVCKTDELAFTGTESVR